MSRKGLLGLVDSLQSAVRKTSWDPEGTEWADYEESHAYHEEALAVKRAVVGDFLDRIAPRKVWDLGANTGAFSRLAAGRAELVVALDSDPGAVEKLFRRMAAQGSETLLPLRVDLTDPTPSRGWLGQERQSLYGRGPADAVLALALVHHLAISGNVPLDLVADGLASLTGKALIIEFVPKDDPQAQRLLQSREDVFDRYSLHAFEEGFRRHFQIVDRRPLPGSERILYLMTVRDPSCAGSAPQGKPPFERALSRGDPEARQST